MDRQTCPTITRFRRHHTCFGRHVHLRRLASVTTRQILASAPCRIDLAGGWTDVAPYTTEVGGAVCNVAIELRATARVSAADGLHQPVDPLVRASWLRAGEPAVSIELSSDIPLGSGLGGSSAAGVAIAAALAAWRGVEMSPRDLAELSRSTEVETMGLAGGCQDHYAAALGGALLLTCATQTTPTAVPLADATITALESRGLIAFTGESRMSSRTITAVINAYRDSEPITCRALRTMARLAPHMAAALADGDVDRLGALIARQWQAQRSLHPTITTPLIDMIIAEAAAAGALGSKALGASGGGCVFVLAAADRADEVRRAVARHATLLPFRIARTGVQVHHSGHPD